MNERNSLDGFKLYYEDIKKPTKFLIRPHRDQWVRARAICRLAINKLRALTVATVRYIRKLIKEIQANIEMRELLNELEDPMFLIHAERRK